MTIKISTKGISKIVSLLQLASKQTKVKISKGVKEATQLLEKEIKASIEGQRAEPRSVDTGEFLNSVKSKTTPTTGVVQSDVKQATFMEFGTSKIHERRHFRNSANRKRADILKLVKANIK